MKDIELAYMRATGGYAEVQDGWVSATALRPVVGDDPCLAWLDLHGKSFGFERDSEDNSMLSLLGEMGHRFEAGWVMFMAPDAVQANTADTDVRHAIAVRRTLELMAKRTPVITKAAVWLAELGIYGTCDVIALASWLCNQFPHLHGFIDSSDDHYVVLDLKCQVRLDSPAKRRDLLLASSQVQLYSHILGTLQGMMPSHAFLVTKDRIKSPLPVVVHQEPDGGLDSFLKEMLTEYNFIRVHGQKLTPWDCPQCPIIAPDFAQSKDAPWTTAKRRIRDEFWPVRPLELLPRVGRDQARTLRSLGLRSVDDMLLLPPSELNLEDIPGFGPATTRLVHSVMDAQRTGRPTPVPASVVPPRKTIELYVDCEYLTPLVTSLDAEWPGTGISGRVFMIGAGQVTHDGEWKFTRFTAKSNTDDAEKAMWQEFVAWLYDAGVFCRTAGAHKRKLAPLNSDSLALYCWSSAERTQFQSAADKFGLSELEGLPWYDLRRTFTEGSIALPNCWSYGLKAITKALGELSPEYKVAYPDSLNSGAEAMVLAWRAFQFAEPVKTPEMQTIEAYLDVDCRSLERVLHWIRRTAQS